MVSWNLSREVETSSRVIYVSLILFHKNLAKESRVSPQLLGYRRTPPHCHVLCLWLVLSCAQGMGLTSEDHRGSGAAVMPHWPIAPIVTGHPPPPPPAACAGLCLWGSLSQVGPWLYSPMVSQLL